MSHTFRRSVLILLEGIALNAAPCGSAELKLFQKHVEQLRADFDKANTPDAVLELTGRAIRIIEEFGAASESFAALQRRQTKETVTLLMHSVREISKAGKDHAVNLRRIETELEKVCGPSDIAPLNERLRICLETIAHESAQEWTRQAPPQIGIDEKSGPFLTNPINDVDAATGLPGVLSAMHAVRTAAAGPAGCHVVAFGIERMEAVNMRFGFRTGDRILLLFAQHIAQLLSPADALYRWRGPCFIAITERDVTESVLAAEADRILGAKLEHNIKMGEREIVLPVTASWTMAALPPASSPDEALQKLDDFAVHRGHVHPEPKTSP